MRYVDGGTVFTAVPDAYFSEAEPLQVFDIIQAAGPGGTTCEAVAKKSGLPLIEVFLIVGEYPDDDC
jgi:hypothetical protein